MALDSTTVRAEVNGDGTAGPYQCGFRVLNDSDLQVYVDGTLKTLTTHYTVANAGSTSNAEVTFTSGNFPASGTKNVVLIRNVPYTQPSNYQNNTALDAETLEASFDRATMQAQQSTEKIDRAIKFSESATEITTSVTEINAPAATRKNKLLAFDNDGNIQIGQEIGTYKGSDATTTTADYVVRDLVKSTTAGQLDNVYICIKDSPSGTALTNTTYWTLIVDAYSASSASTTATTQAGLASDHRADAAKYAVTAEDSAFTLTATNGGTSGLYSAKHYQAKSSADATTASNAKNDAVKIATNAHNSQYTLSDSSTGYSALHYASEASASALAASQSASNAANSFDSFDDRYLGTMADSASGGGNGVSGTFNASKDGPGNDNDGNALVTGALYFNTTDGEMRVYDGSNWIAASAAQNATILEYVYDITGSVTSIVGASGTGFAENNGAAVAFGSTESVHVYLNGVQLIEGASDDYQLTPSTNTVTFNSAVVSGDIVKIVVYKTFTVGDAVPASTGGTFSGDVSFGDNNITNVGDIAVDTISSAGTSVGVTLGSASGNDFNVGSGKLVVEGDTGNVGIGKTPATSVKLDVNGGYQGAGNIITSSGIIRSPDGSAALPSIQPGVDADTGFFRPASNTIGFSTAATERMRIDSSGNVELKTTNANLILPSGGGISFQNHSVSSVTGASSTTSDNVLDDYEEGTFTPSYAPTSGSFASIGYASRIGEYIKVGNVVTCHVLIKTSSLDKTGASGNVKITGFPFGAGGGSNLGALGSVAAQSAWLNFFPTSGWINSTGSMTCINNDGASTAYIQVPIANMSTGSDKNRLYLTVTYITA